MGRLTVMQNSPWQQRFRLKLLFFFSFTIFAWQPKESHYYFGGFIYYVMTGLGYGVFEYSSVPNRHACTFINFEKKIPIAQPYLGLHVYCF